MLSAISVAIISAGLLFPTFDLVAGMLASFSIIVIVCELGRGYALTAFCATATLALVLAPNNSGAWFYAIFMGYYPILKSLIEVKIRNRLTAITIKIITFNITLTIGIFIAVKLFLYERFIGWYAVGLVVLAEASFILYDILLTKIVFYYFRVLRHRLRIVHFLKK